jgi:hypothetical protein
MRNKQRKDGPRKYKKGVKWSSFGILLVAKSPLNYSINRIERRTKPLYTIVCDSRIGLRPTAQPLALEFERLEQGYSDCGFSQGSLMFGSLLLSRINTMLS